MEEPSLLRGDRTARRRHRYPLALTLTLTLTLALALVPGRGQSYWVGEP